MDQDIERAAIVEDMISRLEPGTQEIIRWLGTLGSRQLVLLAVSEKYQDSVKIWDEMKDGTVAAVRFASRGWALSSKSQMSAYVTAAEVAHGGDETGADLLLAESYEGLMRYTEHQVINLVRPDDELVALYAQRGRLVGRAAAHHAAGSYDASVPIYLAQVDGLTCDATSDPNLRGGKTFFRHSASDLDAVEDRSFAGIARSLATVRRATSRHFASTEASGDLGRHGIAHGRELGYDTRINSAKAYALLLAVMDWSRPLLADLVETRRARDDDLWAGSDEVDDHGARRDQRGFATTRDTLRRWQNNRVMSAYGVDPEPVPEGVEEGADTDGIWWARAQSASGWWFALAGNKEHDEFFFDADDPPTGPPGVDGRWVPEDGPVSTNWHPPSDSL